FCNTPSSLLKGTVVMPKRLSEGPTNYRHMSLRLILGLLFSSGIGLIAHRRQSLDKSGVLGAIVCGTSIVGMGGWSWGLSLVYFLSRPACFPPFEHGRKPLLPPINSAKDHSATSHRLWPTAGLPRSSRYAMASHDHRTHVDERNQAS